MASNFKDLFIILLLFVSFSVCAAIDNGAHNGKKGTEEIIEKASARNFGNFGHVVDDRTGSIHWYNVDEVLKTNGMPLILARSFGHSRSLIKEFNNWSIEIPKIVMSASPSGRTRGTRPGSGNGLCSDPSIPYGEYDYDGGFLLMDDGAHWFSGISIEIPNENSIETHDLMKIHDLQSYPAGSRYTSFSNWIAECYETASSISGKAGAKDGFLVRTPNGTKYYFDVITNFAQQYNGTGEPGTIIVYPSRIEDVFGNTTTFTYNRGKSKSYIRGLTKGTNTYSLNGYHYPTPNAQLSYYPYLTKISSNDGVEIIVNYQSPSTISGLHSNYQERLPVIKSVNLNYGDGTVRTVNYSYYNAAQPPATPQLSSIMTSQYINGTTGLVNSLKKVALSANLSWIYEYKNTPFQGAAWTGAGENSYAGYPDYLAYKQYNKISKVTAPSGANKDYTYQVIQTALAGHKTFFKYRDPEPVSLIEPSFLHSCITPSKCAVPEYAIKSIFDSRHSQHYSFSSDSGTSSFTTISYIEHRQADKQIKKEFYRLHCNKNNNAFCTQQYYEGLGLEPWKYGLLLSEEIKDRDGNVVLMKNYDWELGDVVGTRIFHQPHYLPGITGGETDFTWDSDYQRKQKSSETFNQGYNISYLNYDKYGFFKSKVETQAGLPQRKTNYTFNHDQIGFFSVDNWFVGLTKSESIDGESASLLTTYNMYGKVENKNTYGKYFSFTYHSDGTLASKMWSVGAENFLESYDDYYRGLPRLITFANGNTIERLVDGRGNITKEKDEDGYVSNYSYDDLGRILQIAHPSGLPTQITWIDNAPYSSKAIILRGNYKKTIIFDSRHQKAKSIIEEDLSSSEQRYHYINYWSNGLIREVSFSTPYPAYALQPFYPVAKVLYTYDPFGRVLSKKSSTGSVESWCYDSLCQSNEFDFGSIYTNARGFREIQTERLLGGFEARLPLSIKLEKSLNSFVSYDTEYNGFGDIKKISFGGLDRIYNYQIGTRWLEYLNIPEQPLQRFVRDNMGQIVEQYSGGTHIKTLNYDAVGNVTAINYSDTSPDEIFDYDGRGNQILSVKGGIKTEVNYGANGLPSLQKLSLENLIPVPLYEFNFYYDDVDHLEKIKYPSGREYDYVLDAFGGTKSISGIVDDTQYYAFGVLEKIYFSNGLIETTNVDARERPQSTTVPNILGLSYAYDVDNNVTSYADSLTSESRTMSYDGIDRLIHENKPQGDSYFNYDASNNLISMSGTGLNRSFTIDALSNRLDSATIDGASFNYTYDLLGNIVNDGHSIYSFGYDSLLHEKDGEKYFYSANGMRAIKGSLQDGVRYFYSDSGSLLTMIDPVANDYTDYIYLNNKKVAVVKGQPLP